MDQPSDRDQAIHDIDERLEVVEQRLKENAQGPAPTGLTDPDEGDTERWEAAQVWAHMARVRGIAVAVEARTRRREAHRKKARDALAGTSRTWVRAASASASACASRSNAATIVSCGTTPDTPPPGCL